MKKRPRGSGRVFQRYHVNAAGERVLNRWWIEYAFNRQPRREGSWATEREAYDALAERTTQIRHGSFSAEAVTLTVAGALAEWDAHLVDQRAKSLDKFRSRIRCLTEGLGRYRIRELTPPIFRAYTKRRQEAGAADGTLNLEMGCLVSAFNLAIRQGRIAVKPHVPRPPASPARSGFVEVETFDRIHAKLPAPYADLVEFLYLSGWRSTEAKTLTWAHVFLREQEIRLDTSKNGKRRLLVLTGRLGELLRHRLTLRVLSSPYVFHRDGKPVSHALMDRWKAACAEAEAPGLIIHDLRRSAIRNMIRAGVNQTVAKTITGHRSDTVFERYNITTSDDQRRAGDATAAYLATRRAENTVSLTPIHGQALGN